MSDTTSTDAFPDPTDVPAADPAAAAPPAPTAAATPATAGGSDDLAAVLVVLTQSGRSASGSVATPTGAETPGPAAVVGAAVPADTVAAAPVVGEPVVAEPVVAEPVVAVLVVADLVVAEPVEAQTAVPEGVVPQVVEVAAVEPEVAEPAAIEPAVESVETVQDEVPVPEPAPAVAGGVAAAAPDFDVAAAASASPTTDVPVTAEPAVAAPPAPASVPDSNAPRPGPRPSPAALAGLTRPAPPRPVAIGPDTAATAPPAPATTGPELDADEAPVPAPTDSHTFGRVDDDGTVHVTLADGTEQPVGQWAAGTPTEGLAFFVRKYDDLSVEVDLAARRLAEGKAAPEQAGAVVKRARESLVSPSMVGDLASLTARVDALDALVVERRAAAAELRAVAKAAALAAREAIVAEAEALAQSTQWKSTGDRFKTLLDDWKSAPRADRAGEQALWKRFSHARSQFDKHRRQYFARLDSERGEAKQVKESLVAEAEALSGSTDWGATAGSYRDLMARWKASGRAGKADEDELWTRFRAAQDSFFSARNAALGQRDAGFAENLAAKEALLVQAEAILTADLKSAKSTLRSIQEKWEQVGHVPRGDKERIEARLRKVEEKLRSGEQDQWRRTNPEARARAEATVEQFQGSLTKLEKQRAAAEAAGDTRKVADADSRITTTKALLDAAQKAAAEFGA